MCSSIPGQPVQCFGESGSYSCELGQSYNSGCSCASCTKVTVSISGTVELLGTGMSHTCAYVSSGELYCWGNCAHGECGDGTDGESQRAHCGKKRAAIAGPLSHLALGGQSTCVALKAGGIQCFGIYTAGQLHNGADNTYPNYGNHRYPNMVRVGQVDGLTMGHRHACAILPDFGGVYCWGRNTEGQLGAGNTNPPPWQGRPLGQSIKALSGNFDFIVSNPTAYFTCAVPTNSNGAVKCWGENSNGQLGDGTTVSRLSPITTNVGGPIQQIVAGSKSVCVLLTSGVMKCWGIVNGQTTPTTFNAGTKTIKTFTLSRNRLWVYYTDGTWKSCYGF